jgi:hypothetical protein
MPTVTQPRNLGDLLKYEAPNLYSRDQDTVAAAQNLPLGTVVGRETATAKLKALDLSATDGTETAVGVLGNDVDATLIDREDAILIARHAIVARGAVIWPTGSAFEVKRASFVASMVVKVFDKKANELPALWVGSKIPWLGLHEQGGTVSGKLLIPLLPGRIGPKHFKAVIDGLMRSGNAYFIEKNGRVLLMAENIAENSRQLTRFKRAERGRTGAKQIKRVDLKRRLNLAGGVQRALPALARAIQQELDKV